MTGITVTGIAVNGITVTGITATGVSLYTRDSDWYNWNDWCDTEMAHVATHRHTDKLVCWYY